MMSATRALERSKTTKKKKTTPATTRKTPAPAVAPVLEGDALIDADMRAARGAPTNSLDAHVAAAVNMSVLSRAYLTPDKIISPAGRARAVRLYFDPAKGTATLNQHQDAVPMMEYMKAFMIPKVITDAAHPVVGQIGVFARRAIPVDTVLGMYGGLVTSSAYADMEHRQTNKCDRSPVDEARKCRFYIWGVKMRENTVSKLTDVPAKREMLKLQYQGSRPQITRETGLEILGAHVGGNMLRFINGNQGIARDANVVVLNVWWQGLPRVLYVTRYNIPAGRELLVDYGSEHTFGAEELSAETGVDVEDSSTGELVVARILSHKPAARPTRFRVEWGDGSETWEPASAFIEFDPSDPSQPYIFNTQFLAYLAAKGIDKDRFLPPALVAIVVEETTEDKDGGEVAVDAIVVNDDDAVVVAPVPVPVPAPVPAPLPIDDSSDGETADETRPASAPNNTTEARVLKIDDMNYKGKGRGYEFHVHWDDGTAGWADASQLADADPLAPGGYVYTEALIVFLDAHGITDYAAVLKDVAVPIRLRAHTYAPQSRVDAPPIRFSVTMSNGTVQSMPLEAFVTLIVDASGVKVAQPAVLLKEYAAVRRRAHDDEFARFLAANLRRMEKTV